jgi:hypothetical protein
MRRGLGSRHGHEVVRFKNLHGITSPLHEG